ncbi:hypothetical protein EVAR_78578_1 [Eumeta japonica]|uniref:Uncharacterized protein n=1 Tax=Eumeta variegata TaxID=151549 RepID=A0A4C1W9R4_EUMVA|nr:hypothetical protein EVAR_78578_1 [Eumeta japonica]
MLMYGRRSPDRAGVGRRPRDGHTSATPITHQLRSSNLRTRLLSRRVLTASYYNRERVLLELYLNLFGTALG